MICREFGATGGESRVKKSLPEKIEAVSEPNNLGKSNRGVAVNFNSEMFKTTRFSEIWNYGDNVCVLKDS